MPWTPVGGVWKDTGDFSKGVTEFNDPVQGAVADCWLIAALAAIAWADPQAIVHRNRATGPGKADRANAITLYSKWGNHDAPTGTVEVADKTPVASNGIDMYCHSSDPGEIWPAVYEKAFAKWSAANTTDQPDICALAYGSSSKAIAQLTNKAATIYATSTRTASEPYQLVRANSLSYKTIYPVTAWTYSGGDPGDPRRSGTNIVANHAYTILGWAWQGGKGYVALRNPWGRTEPNGLNTYQGLLSFFDKELLAADRYD